MKAYILRHGTASHLLEDLNRKVNHSECLVVFNNWNQANLTDLGEEEVGRLVFLLENMYSHIFYSPLKRTEQTARAFLHNPANNAQLKALPQLSEIHITPPRLPKKMRIKLKHWIFLCVVKSIFTLSIFRYLYQARQIMHLIKHVKGDILIISHQARIFTLLVYTFLNPSWKVIKTNLNPAGLSIIEKKK